MTRLTPSFFSLLFCTLLCACSTQTQTPTSTNADLRAESAVSVKDPNFTPSPGVTLSWMQPLSWEGVALSAQTEEWSEFMQNAIEDEFSSKGYQVKGLVNGEAPDYQILGYVVMGELSDHPDLEAIFRLYPDAGKSTSERQKGTLILALLPSSGRAQPAIYTAWRGAVQIFREHVGELDTENSHKRVTLAIKDLMSSIPATTTSAQ